MPDTEPVETEDGIIIYGVPKTVKDDDPRIWNLVRELRKLGLKSGTFGQPAKAPAAPVAPTPASAPVDMPTGYGRDVGATQQLAGAPIMPRPEVPAEPRMEDILEPGMPLPAQAVSDKVEGALAAGTRGLGPTALGALGGFALGGPPGAAAGASAMALTQFVGDPLVKLINNLFGTQIGTPTEALNQLFTWAKVPEADSWSERIIQAGATGGGSAAAMAELGRAMANAGRTLAPSLMKAIGEALKTGGIARQTLSGITGGGSAQAAAELGAPAPVQLAAGIFGGAVTDVVTGLSSAPSKLALAEPALDAAQKMGVRVLPGDVSPPQTALGKWTRTTINKLPFSPGGLRAKQQAERIAATQDLLTEYGAKDLAVLADDISTDLIANRAKELQKWKGNKMEVINKLSSSELTDPDAWATPQQAVSSKSTSLRYPNPDKTAPKIFSAYRDGKISLGPVNADIGGGQYDDITNWLESKGVKNIVWDRFNRDKSFNAMAESSLRGGQADTATVSNVLNVIPETAARKAVIATAKDTLRPGGKAYFTMYAAPKAGLVEGRDAFQAGTKAKTYIPEIEQVFGPGSVQQSGDILIATKSLDVPPMAPKPVPTPNTTKAIEAAITELKAGPSANQPLIKTLQAWTKDATGKNLSNLEELRKVMRNAKGAPELATIKTKVQEIAKPVYTALRQDMGDYIKANGGIKDFVKWKDADVQLAKMAGELQHTALRVALNEGKSQPSTVYRALNNTERKTVETLYRNLTPQGRINAQAAILSEAAGQAGLDVAPDKLLRNVKRLGNQTGVFFQGDDAKRLDSFERVIELTKEAAQANVMPKTGMTLLPVAIYTSVYNALEHLLGVGPLTSLTAAGTLAGAGTLARGYSNLYSATMRNPELRHLLQKLPSVVRGSPAEQVLLKRLVAISNAMSTRNKTEDEKQEEGAQ